MTDLILAAVSAVGAWVYAVIAVAVWRAIGERDTDAWSIASIWTGWLAASTALFALTGIVVFLPHKTTGFFRGCYRKKTPGQAAMTLVADACGERDPSRQWCLRCGAQDGFSFRVSDETWRAVVGDGPPILCLRCFDALATKRGVPYARSLSEVIFVGDQGSFTFLPESALDREDWAGA